MICRERKKSLENSSQDVRAMSVEFLYTVNANSRKREEEEKRERGFKNKQSDPTSRSKTSPGYPSRSISATSQYPPTSP